MFSRYRELWYAFAAVIVISAIYLGADMASGVFPAASSVVGHSIGALGLVLMLLTESLYSIRKQVSDVRWGNMVSWLRFHIVTGLVGPYMVFLHAAMKFRGLAGLAMLLTALVVLSGIVGRYIYTAIPRAIDGTDPEPIQRETRIRRLAARRGVFAAWHSIHVPLTWALFAAALVHTVAALYYVTLAR